MATDSPTSAARRRSRRPPRPDTTAKVARRQRWVLLGALLIAVMGVGFFLAPRALASLRDWRQERWAQFGEASLRATDYRAASLWALRLLQADPQGRRPAQLIADVEDSAGAAAALRWRLRVAQLSPGESGALLALAKTALRLEKTDLAGRALRLIPKEDQDSLAYHSLAAAWSANSGRMAAAEVHFAACVLLEPGNPDHHINLATLRADSPRPEAARAARGELEKWAATPGPARASALRALATVLLRARDPAARDPARAVALAGELVALEASPGDPMLRLDALRQANSPGYAPAFAKQKSLAESDPNRIAALVNWMNARGMLSEARRWLAGLGPAARLPVGAQVAGADTLVNQRDWVVLRTYLAPLTWGRLDFLRVAMLLRVLREQPGDEDDFSREWQAFGNALRREPEASLMMANVTEAWGWTNEAEEFLRQTVRGANPAMRTSALGALFRLSLRQRRGDQLLTVARLQHEDDPANPALQNNFAYLSLLAGVNLDVANRISAELHARFPRDATITNTRALSLLLAGQPDEALAALEALDPIFLDQPGTALTRAAALARLGRRDDANRVLQSFEVTNLLPDEEKILTSLRQTLSNR